MMLDASKRRAALILIFNDNNSSKIQFQNCRCLLDRNELAAWGIISYLRNTLRLSSSLELARASIKQPVIIENCGAYSRTALITIFVLVCGAYSVPVLLREALSRVVTRNTVSALNLLDVSYSFCHQNFTHINLSDVRFLKQSSRMKVTKGLSDRSLGRENGVMHIYRKSRRSVPGKTISG